MENVKNAAENKNFCHDCKKEIKIKNGELVDAVCLAYKDGKDEYEILKCNSCYQESKALSGFQPCEVYSRVVGYIRPIQQWNPSKTEEYSERREFSVERLRRDCC